MGDIFKNQVRNAINSDLVYDNAITTVEWDEMQPIDFIEFNTLIHEQSQNQPGGTPNQIIANYVDNGRIHRRHRASPSRHDTGTRSDGTLRARAMTYAFVEAYYFIGSTTFRKGQGQNEIQALAFRPDGTHNFTAHAECFRQTGTAVANNVASGATIRDSTIETWGSELQDTIIDSHMAEISISSWRSITQGGLFGGSLTATSQTTARHTNLTNLRNLAQVRDNGDSFTVNYMCLVGYKTVSMNNALRDQWSGSTSISSVNTDNGGSLQRNIPNRLILNFNGDVRRIDLTQKVKRTFSTGQRGRIITMRTSTLFTTIPQNTQFGTMTRGEFNARQIVSKWQNGKQSISLTKETPTTDDIEVVRNVSRVFNVRQDQLTNVNAQSIAQNPDGTAKSFDITRARFVYDGARQQDIEMLERT